MEPHAATSNGLQLFADPSALFINHAGEGYCMTQDVCFLFATSQLSFPLYPLCHLAYIQHSVNIS